MRLAFCFISNRYDRFENLINSFQYKLSIDGPVNSFTKNVLTNPPFPFMYIHADGWNNRHVNYYFNEALDMFTMRQDSFDMARHSDLIFVGDDDFEFKEGSTEAINQCCWYMEDNPECGAIYLGGNFGGEGDYHGDEIYIANKGSLGTNRGILVRNRPVIMDDAFHALGACEDGIIGFTCLLQGYYIARRLHVPIEHNNKGFITKDNDNINYNWNYIRLKGIGARVNEVIGDWEVGDDWPEGIFKLYRSSAMIDGFIPKYSAEGEIIGDQNVIDTEDVSK